MISGVSASTIYGSMAVPKPVIRQSVHYHPTIWGDYFLRYTNSIDAISTTDKERVAELALKVKKMLVVDAHNLVETLKLIDQIQRLGIAYKFEPEIKEGLEQIHMIYFEHENGIINEVEDLFTTSLLFRLLRQQGYKISCDIFNKFRDDKEIFKESLTTDVQGLLSLYEASHLRIHGEDILEEALSFTSTHLNSMKSRLNPYIAKQVEYALDLSLRHGLTRLRARQYMTIYENDTCCEEIIITLAKLDFNLLQKLHQVELYNITRWWKELDFKKKLPFARDRVVEGYFWTLGIHFEPDYALSRKFVTKVIAMATTLDDIYDIYGTIEELEVFTKAIERWDIRTMDDLPEYMQVCYKALLEVYDEIEETLSQQGRSYRFHYAKEAMKIQIRSYMDEARRLHQIPIMEDYMLVSSVSTVHGLLATMSLIGMGDIVTKDVFEWLLSNPKIMKASTTIGRLMDDIHSRKREKEIVHIATAIDCYMNQYKVTEEEARKELQKQIADAWKDMNEECLHPTVFPMKIITMILNLTCVTNVVYIGGEDHYSDARTKMKNYVKFVLVEQVTV